MQSWIIKLIFGVEISSDNFRISGVFASALVIFFGYLLLSIGDFFGVIDNLLTLAEQPWYSFYLAKFSFLMIFVKIILLSLFTTKNNPTGRFIAAFVTQLIGLILTVVLHMSSNIFENLISDPQMKTLVAILPYIFSLMIFLIIRGIYEVEYFDERRFFNSQ